MLGENRSERAIVLIDLINEFAHHKGDSFISSVGDIIPYVQGELQYFRERMRPVLFCSTKIYNKEPFLGAVIRELTPRRGEICIDKSHPDAFWGTDLAQVLRGLKVKNLTIVGMPLTTSIVLTAASAIQHGFSVVVPETCVCSPNEEDHLAALRLIALWSQEGFGKEIIS